MGCFTPYYVTSQQLFVPCGKCYNCRLQKRQAWCFRLQQELQAHDVAFFVTFTYDDKNVPNKVYDTKHLASYQTDNFNTLSKVDASNLIKSLQKNLRRRFFSPYTSKSGKVKNGALVRYYLIGEYGDKVHITHGTNRPHYHAILYFPKGCSRETAIEVINDSWQLGIVDIQPVTYADINYCAKHQFKESRGNDYQRRHAPIFATMSRFKGGLGDNYTKFVSRRNPTRNSKLYVLLNGYRLALPQFYRKKLFPEKMTDAEMAVFRSKNLDDYGRKFAAAFGITSTDNGIFHDTQGQAGRYLYKEFRDLGFTLSNMRWRRYLRQKFTRNYVRARLHAQRLNNDFLTRYYNSRNNVQYIQSQKASA